MQVVILGGFLIVFALQGAPSLDGALYLTVQAVSVYLLGVVVLVGANTATSLRAFQKEDRKLSATMKRHNVLTVLTQIWLWTGLAAMILLGCGRFVIDALDLSTVPLTAELIVLMPFFLGVLLVWTLDYPYHREARRRVNAWRSAPTTSAKYSSAQSPRETWSLKEYLGYHVRHSLLFIAVPVILILLTMDCLTLLVSWMLPGDLGHYVLLAIMPLAGGGIFFLIPLLLVRIWKTHSLPSGALRDELEAMCRQFKLKYRDILVWGSGGMVANAGVMGLTGPVRYILLSDALLEEMDRRQIKAIFAHETGHIVNHHIFYSALFAAGTITVCVSMAQRITDALNVSPWAAQIFALSFLGIVWGVGFGWLSRCFERQCDVIAAWACGQGGAGNDPDLITHEGAAVFAQALQRVGKLNGIPLRQRNWRHGSIAKRVSYILWLGSTAGSRRKDDRTIRRIKAGLWILAALGAILTTQSSI